MLRRASWASGEIGLDYYYDHSPRDVQREAFAAQLDYAYRKGVPAVFHVRDAHGDFTDILRARKGSLPQGVMHCYTGSLESAKTYLDLGFYISFSGSVTFKNADPFAGGRALSCRWTACWWKPTARISRPFPCGAKRNEPAYVRYVAEKVAELRGCPVDALTAQTDKNAERLFKL